MIKQESDQVLQRDAEALCKAAAPLCRDIRITLELETVEIDGMVPSFETKLALRQVLREQFLTREIINRLTVAPGCTCQDDWPIGLPDRITAAMDEARV